jgi:hypothetical protein
MQQLPIGYLSIPFEVMVEHLIRFARRFIVKAWIAAGQAGLLESSQLGNHYLESSRFFRMVSRRASISSRSSVRILI